MQQPDPVPTALPYSLCFTDPSLKEARKIFFKTFAFGSFLIVLIIYCVLAIYWGALWKIPANKLDGWLVDFDGSTLGSAVVQGLTRDTSPEARVTWKVMDAAQFSGPDEVAHLVVEQKTWVAVVVHADATSNLTSAINNQDASYNGSQAVTFFAVEARNENAFRVILRPYVQSFLDATCHSFAQTFAAQLASTDTDVAALLDAAPQVITQPLAYTIDNLRPFDVPVASAVTFIGLIYLLVICFFIVLIGASARMLSGIEPKLTTVSLIKMRLTTIFICYFVLSLFYSALSSAFQVDFGIKFGNSGFLVLWALNFVGMLAVGLALEAMFTILTHRFMPYFMITWIIVNVSVSFQPIEVLPSLYKYGRAFPFYNIGGAIRTIIFSTKNELGLHFGILIIWMVASMVTLPLFTWYTRRGPMKQARAAAAAAAASSKN
ncbi:hypothetical protein CPB85DRAFT_1217167 [Mucidula mucida]|nr:hypothetical protein CPB85DRAFT_1217167 [Mucidula mucida]